MAVLPVFPKNGPVRFRQTLLSLYRQSDVIFIGRFDKKEDFGTNRVGDGFNVVTTRTYFDVSTVLKGETRKFAIIEDEEFRYQIQATNENEAPREAAFIEDIGSFDAGKQPKPSDTVLVFLKDAGGILELVDQRDGIKTLSPSDETIFANRIRELNSIFANGKPQSSEIADWLIRCAQQPVTRWDGAHELVQGFRRLEWQQDQRQPAGIDPLVTASDGMDAANTLSTERRTALTQILLLPDTQLGEPKAKQLSDGDRELVVLVKRWDSSFVASYLIEQLRSRAFSDHENVGMMFMVSEFLGDKQAEILARRYAEVSASDDTPNRSPNEKLGTVGQSRSNILASFLMLADHHLALLSSKQPC